MESQRQQKNSKGTWTTFGKLVVVGTVAAVCGLAALFSGNQAISSVNLVSLNSGYSQEVEQAYIEHLAKYGKQFAMRNDVPNSFKNFANNYELVKKNNANPNRLCEMELNEFSDMSAADLKSIKPELDELRAITTDTSFKGFKVLQLLDSVDWSKTNKLAPV